MVFVKETGTQNIESKSMLQLQELTTPSLCITCKASITPRTVLVILAGTFRGNTIILLKHVNCTEGTRAITLVSQIQM
ncbi:hypothetical protein ABKV19_022530 [Rosa sericea]